ncbi:hypothetical protein ACWCV9_08515 [Streptomyces sp. NPDC001606]
MRTLRYADDVLDPAAPSADRPAWLHDLGVVARWLLTVVEMIAEYEARRGSMVRRRETPSPDQ